MRSEVGALDLGRRLKSLGYRIRSDFGKGPRGWANALYYGLFRINTFKILRGSADHYSAKMPSYPGISYSMIDAAELDNLRARKDLPREFYCDRFQRVGHCCVALVEHEVAHIHWVYFRGDFSRFLRITENSAEVNYVHTLARHRGRGIATGALLHTMRYLQNRGIRDVFAVIHSENLASIKSFTRAGFSEVGSTVSVGPFNRKFALKPDARGND